MLPGQSSLQPSQSVLHEDRFEHIHRYERLLDECANELTMAPTTNYRLISPIAEASSTEAATTEAAKTVVIATTADDAPGAALRRVDKLANKLAQHKSRLRKPK